MYDIYIYILYICIFILYYIILYTYYIYICGSAFAASPIGKQLRRGCNRPWERPCMEQALPSPAAASTTTNYYELLYCCCYYYQHREDCRRLRLRLRRQKTSTTTTTTTAPHQACHAANPELRNLTRLNQKPTTPA